MGTSEDALNTLAAKLGIAREYESAWGDTRPVSREAIIRVIEAMGLRASSPEQQRASLAEVDERSWARLLEPVVVRVAGSGVRAVLSLPHASGHGTAHCRVVLEDGSVREARRAVSSMRELESGAFGTRRELVLEEVTPPAGYHRLEVGVVSDARVTDGTCSLIVVPERAFGPAHWEQGGRDWGITTQLYSLRSERNWGIGDFTDLTELTRGAAQQGVALVGLNPLHALFPADPGAISPYSPSSRSFLNPIYIDVLAVPECEEAPEARRHLSSIEETLERSRATEQVDYAQVWRCKEAALRLLYRHFRLQAFDGTEPRAGRGRAFRDFQRQAGAPLRAFALFHALQAHLVAQGFPLNWREWPEPYRDRRSPEVEAFEQANGEEIEFLEYLQFEADRQLGLAAEAAREGGMRMGLYRDVAVGVSPDGAEAWSDPGLLTSGASVGAPPDVFNPKGQNWGLTPLNPLELKARAYAPFIAAVRANMRHSGAIRIDHVIGLGRLWWVPRACGADEGAYVTYPLDDLLGIIALESQRHGCLVIGEDLGTVPKGFRRGMQSRGILSYRLLMFEREDGKGPFFPPDAYPELAAVAVSTHDLATLRGFWSGRDLEVRKRLELFPSAESEAEAGTFREQTRKAMLQAFSGELGPLDPQAAQALGGPQLPLQEDAYVALAQASHAYLSRTPSRLLLVQLEDLVGQLEQMNLPGTIHEHPNWRRKLALPVERIFDFATVREVVSVIRALRGEAPVRPHSPAEAAGPERLSG